MSDDPPLNATGHNLETRQDRDKTRKRIRSGEGTVAYWKAKLFHNSYRDRHGRTVEMPEYYVRLRHDGLTKRVRLHTSDKDRAAEEALRLSERLREEGWSAVAEGQARLPASPSIDEFCDAYRKAAAGMERPPRPISVAGYIRHFRQVCSLAGVSRLRELTTESIERARDKYRAEARAKKRSESAIQNSLGMILRNAAACFSADARAVMGRQGLNVENPFVGIRRSQRIEPVTALPRTVVERIWTDLPRLRDGDPEAPTPDRTKFAKQYRKNHEGRKPRWMPIDFARPHPDAYCAILLALGAGLRANEIDKARWTWLKVDEQGNCFLEVREEDDFIPKGGTLRVIRIPKELHDELARTRSASKSPYILGGTNSKSVDENGWGYRCRETLRVASAWLRARGVESDEERGNPLHRCRGHMGVIARRRTNRRLRGIRDKDAQCTAAVHGGMTMSMPLRPELVRLREKLLHGSKRSLASPNGSSAYLATPSGESQKTVEAPQASKDLPQASIARTDNSTDQPSAPTQVVGRGKIIDYPPPPPTSPTAAAAKAKLDGDRLPDEEGTTETLLRSVLLPADRLQEIEVPQRENLCGTWMKQGDLGFVFGPRGIGKTWLTALFARSLAEGKPIGHWPVTKARRVLYVDGEMPLDGMRERDAALRSSTGELYVLNHEWMFQRADCVLNLSSLTAQQALLQLCVHDRFDVLILDNLSCLFSGVAENDADSWEQVLPWLLSLRRHKVAVIIVHHANRTGVNMRGTSRREDAAFWVLRLDSVVDHSKETSGARFISRFTKTRQGRAEELEPLEWRFEPHGNSTRVTIKEMPTITVFRQLVRDGMHSCTDIAEEMAISRGQVSKLAKRGEREGWLKIEHRSYKLAEGA